MSGALEFRPSGASDTIQCIMAAALGFTAFIFVVFRRRIVVWRTDLSMPILRTTRLLVWPVEG